MIKGSSTHVTFVCDNCGAEEKGRMVDIPGTSRQIAIEPVGWERRNVKKLSGFVFRHYCSSCSGIKPEVRAATVLKFTGDKK